MRKEVAPIKKANQFRVLHKVWIAQRHIVLNKYEK